MAAFSPAFLDGEPRALSLLPDDFRHAERRGQHVQHAARRRISPVTLGALRAQASSLAPSSQRNTHLAALEKPGTAVVVTGQQVGLFLGPLYSFYKAASCIAVARALSEETKIPCVPVFWLQSEDHDFPEIDHCHAQTRDGELQRITMPAPLGDPRRSVSSLTLGPQVDQALHRLDVALHGNPHLAPVMALLRRHYRPEAGWVQAFASTLGEVFADEGLVVLDPRDPALVAEVRPLHLRAVKDVAALDQRLLERARALEHQGFEAQVQLRPGVPLSFVHLNGFDGPRLRMAAEAVPPQAVFSSSALLRPIIQDTLLPTAAIVAGPGELNYFAQVGPLYDAFELPMPMLVPRGRFRVLEARPRALLEKLRLDAAQLEAPREKVLETLRPHGDAQGPRALEAALTAAAARVLATVPRSPALGDAVERTQATIERAASRLAGRYARTLQSKDETVVARVDALQRALFPGGEPQERVLSWPHFASRIGLQEFKALVLEALEPFGTQVKELRP
jgi:bacillithiol synthase